MCAKIIILFSMSKNRLVSSRQNLIAFVIDMLPSPIFRSMQSVNDLQSKCANRECEKTFRYFIAETTFIYMYFARANLFLEMLLVKNESKIGYTRAVRFSLVLLEAKSINFNSTSKDATLFTQKVLWSVHLQ